MIDGISMIDRNPPDHTRLRRLVQKAFTPPPMDHAHIRELSGTVVRALEPIADPELMKAIETADTELAGITAEMIAWKRRNPSGDLMTALIEAEEDGETLSDEELIAQVELLYIAGHETTVNLLSGGTLALLRHPDQLAALRANGALLPNAIEELLRYDSPLQSSRRITLEAMTIDGFELPPGALVIAILGRPTEISGSGVRMPIWCGWTGPAHTGPVPQAGAGRRRDLERSHQRSWSRRPSGIGPLAATRGKGALASWPPGCAGAHLLGDLLADRLIHNMRGKAC